MISEDTIVAAMQRECLAKIDAEIESQEMMIAALRQRRKEVEEDCDIRQIVSLNASLSYHNKVKK